MSAAKISTSDRFRYLGEAVVFFVFMGLFRLLGLEKSSALGSWFGRHLFSRLPPDRIARANLRTAYPEKSEAELDAIRMQMWDNLGRVVAEYAHFHKFSYRGADPRLTFTPPAPGWFDSHRDQPVLYLSAHLGNWEMMPILCEQLALGGATVIRPPNNPYVAKWIARVRRANGPDKQIVKQHAMRRMLTQLREGKPLYMLVDQKLREGLAVSFFGRDALTTPAPAALALKTGARIVIVSNRRIIGSRFHMTFYSMPDFTPDSDEAQNVLRLTAAITARIEEIVRADPGQWLWIHNRWVK